MRNFLRHSSATSVLSTTIADSEHPNSNPSEWKVDLVLTEIELISKNPNIDGQHKLILEWVITPPDYDAQIDNRLTMSPKGALRYRSAMIVKEKIMVPNNEEPIVFSDIDMVNGMPVIPDNAEYVWYQETTKNGKKDCVLSAYKLNPDGTPA